MPFFPCGAYFATRVLHMQTRTHRIHCSVPKGPKTAELQDWAMMIFESSFAMALRSSSA